MQVGQRLSDVVSRADMFGSVEVTVEDTLIKGTKGIAFRRAMQRVVESVLHDVAGYKSILTVAGTLRTELHKYTSCAVAAAVPQVLQLYITRIIAESAADEADFENGYWNQVAGFAKSIITGRTNGTASSSSASATTTIDADAADAEPIATAAAATTAPPSQILEGSIANESIATAATAAVAAAPELDPAFAAVLASSPIESIESNSLQVLADSSLKRPPLDGGGDDDKIFAKRQRLGKLPASLVNLNCEAMRAALSAEHADTKGVKSVLLLRLEKLRESVASEAPSV